MSDNFNDLYCAAHDRVQRVLGDLTSRLYEHTTKQAWNQKNYGYVSDIEHVADLLQDAVDYLASQEGAAR